MSTVDSVESWLLVDNKDIVEREASGGFSAFERKGDRELAERPRCPICGRQVWPKAVTYMESIQFSGFLIGDAAWGNSTTFVVSGRFVKHWRESGMQGLEFSSNPVDVQYKLGSKLRAGKRDFFLANPEPRVTQFKEIAEVQYRKPPRCSVCSSSEVISLERLVFDPIPLQGTDCCLPSSLPGWVLVSSSFRKFVEEFRLMNFHFLEGFERVEGRKLIRRGYWMQLWDGTFRRIAECSEEMLAEIRHSHPHPETEPGFRNLGS